jgi:hypothetical protein
VIFLKYVAQADEVWHAGDIGNLAVTDAIKAKKTVVWGMTMLRRMEFPLHNRFMCEGRCLDYSYWRLSGNTIKY